MRQLRLTCPGHYCTSGSVDNADMVRGSCQLHMYIVVVVPDRRLALLAESFYTLFRTHLWHHETGQSITQASQHVPFLSMVGTGGNSSGSGSSYSPSKYTLYTYMWLHGWAPTCFHTVFSALADPSRVCIRTCIVSTQNTRAPETKELNHYVCHWLSKGILKNINSATNYRPCVRSNNKLHFFNYTGNKQLNHIIERRFGCKP